MSEFIPDSEFLQRILLHYFLLQKTASESSQILMKVYGERAPTEQECEEIFLKYQNQDFNIVDQATKEKYSRRKGWMEHLQKPPKVLQVPSPKKKFLRGVLLHYFNMKMGVGESNHLLERSYGGESPTLRTCGKWFHRFRNRNFSLEDVKQVRAPRKFKDLELETILENDPMKTQRELAKELGVTQRAISHRLKRMGAFRKGGKKLSFTNRSNS